MFRLRSPAGSSALTAFEPTRKTWLTELAGWGPLFFLLCVIVGLRLAGSHTSYEHQIMTLVVYLVFAVPVSGLVAALLAVRFLAEGAPKLLLVGMGALFWACAGAAGAMVGINRGQGDFTNTLLTIHNSGMWFSALCHLIGATLPVGKHSASAATRRTWLGMGFGIAFTTMGGIVLATLNGLLPRFFVPGVGPTLVRELVLYSAAAMLGVTGLFFALERPRDRQAFTYWYGLALLLFAAGILALVLSIPGTLLGWTGRITLALGGIYMLIAVLKNVQQGSVHLVPDAAISEGRLGYAVAVAVVAAAAAVRAVFLPGIGNGYAFATFYPAIAFAALYGGGRAGLLGISLAVLAATYFWMEPPGQFMGKSYPDRLATGIFVLSSLIIVWMASRMRTAQLVAQRAEKARAAALWLTENRLQAFTEHSPVPVAIFDREMRYAAASRGWLKEFGLPEDGVIGRCHYDLFPDLPEKWKVAHSKGLAGEVVRTLGDSSVRPDGSVRWFNWEVWPWQDQNGDVAGIVVTDEEITEQKEAEARLQDSESRLALALAASGSAVWEMDVATRVVTGDDKIYLMLGYAPGEIKTIDDWGALVHPEDSAGIPEMIGEAIDGERDHYRFEARLRTKNGDWRWNLSQAVVAGRDSEGRALRLVGTHTDTTDRKLAEQRIREVALHDPLTGLPNRALVFEYGSHLLASGRRTQTHGALLFIDLDRFKPINDIYGHNTGDRVLQEVSKRLLACTRREDLVGRLGGDEFVILLPHLDVDRRRAAVVAQHVIESINQPFLIDAIELSLSPSIGISYFPEHADNMGDLIHAADLAMYQAKQAGRSNYQFYRRELDQQADEIYALEGRLKEALKHDGLSLYYQPVIDIANGRLIGAEALIRLTDNGNAVGPARFIPVAESAGLIGDLGEWVMREACRQHGRWLKDGLRISVAINVSPLQFRQSNFAETLSHILKETGTDPTCLHLEVTESMVMSNVDDAIEILEKIKALGVKVALDDFGTGHSSLSLLATLPLDKLKVDQSFVRSIDNDEASRAVTEAIITLGRKLRLDVVGEGIESEHALRYLQETGCNQAQGFWFSQPLPASDFAQWHVQHRLH